MKVAPHIYYRYPNVTWHGGSKAHGSICGVLVKWSSSTAPLAVVTALIKSGAVQGLYQRLCSKFPTMGLQLSQSQFVRMVAADVYLLASGKPLVPVDKTIKNPVTQSWFHAIGIDQLKSRELVGGLRVWVEKEAIPNTSVLFFRFRVASSSPVEVSQVKQRIALEVTESETVLSSVGLTEEDMEFNEPTKIKSVTHEAVIHLTN